jgi:ribosomal protein S18 acetylase RimI-like enzyme
VGSRPSIRRYRPDDLDALYRICHLTGWAGGDATGHITDERLLGDVYAAPYAVLEPESAFVLDDGSGQAVGYVLGAVDTRAFEAACEERWWPEVRARRPRTGRGTLDDLFVGMIHEGRRTEDDALLDRYPSHLHIDLLASHQGQGWGRRLIDRLRRELVARGSHGVHLGVSSANTGAVAFYRRLGFTLLGEGGRTLTFGRALP